MHEGKSMIGAARQVAVISLATVILAIAPLYGAHAAQHTAGKAAASESEDGAMPPQIAELTALLADPKNRLLLTLLADPTVQKWLEKQGLPKAAAEPALDKLDESVSHYFDSRVRATREHVVAMASALPDLPNQFERGFGLLQAEIPRRGTVLLLVLVFAGLGFGVRVAVSQDDAEDTPAARRSPNGEGERPPTSRHCALRLCLRHRCGLCHRQRWPLLGARLAAAP